MLLERLQMSADKFIRGTAILGGYALLGLSIAICLEIVLRRFAGVSLQGVDEVGGYVLAGVSAFGFAFALLHRAHTRIDIFLRRGGAPVQAALNLLNALLFAAVAIFMAWRAYATLARSVALGSIAATPLQTPIWIPQVIWFGGLVFFAAVASLLALRGLLRLDRGSDDVNAVLGPLSLSQELEAESDLQQGAEGGASRSRDRSAGDSP